MFYLYIMKKKLYQLINDDEGLLGLYSVPNEIGQGDFMTEWNKFDDQNDFDEKNTINAERMFVDEIFTDNPFL